MQYGRGLITSSGGVGTLSTWGLVGLRSSLALWHRPEMAGGHRHLTYTWRVYNITHSHIAPLDLVPTWLRFLSTTQFLIFHFFSCSLAQTAFSLPGSMMHPSSRDPLPTGCLEIVEQVQLLLVAVDTFVTHSPTHTLNSPGFPSFHQSAPQHDSPPPSTVRNPICSPSGLAPETQTGTKTKTNQSG